MKATRARILGGSALAASLLASLWATPAAAADCSLAAPATAQVGSPLTIDGAGFPVNSSVAIKLSIEGGTADAFTVQSNASGAFQINLTPEATDVGKTTAVATSGSVCSAQAVYMILGAGQTAAPTAEPSSSAAGTGAQPSAPRTDAVQRPGAGGVNATPALWLLAILVLTIGAGGLVATRPTRRR